MQKYSSLTDCSLPVWAVGGIKSWEGGSAIKFREFSICGKRFSEAEEETAAPGRAAAAQTDHREQQPNPPLKTALPTLTENS